MSGFYSLSLTEGLKFVSCVACQQSFEAVSEIEAARTLLEPKQVKDFNSLVVIRCPHCGSGHSFFVALHKYKDDTLALCVQRTDQEGVDGIPADWWMWQ